MGNVDVMKCDGKTKRSFILHNNEPQEKIADHRPKIKKRKYSRKGCQECKRRKMKCDESKPSCKNCIRLTKKCIYNVKEFKFETIVKETSDNVQGNVNDYCQNSKGPGKDIQMRFYKPSESFTDNHKPKFLNENLSNLKEDQIVAHPVILDSNHTRHMVMDTAFIDSSKKKVNYCDFNFNSLNNEIRNDSNDPVTDKNGVIEMQGIFDEAMLLINELNNILGTEKIENVNSSGEVLGDLFKTPDIGSHIFDGNHYSPIKDDGYFEFNDLKSYDDLNDNESSLSNSNLLKEIEIQYNLSQLHIKYLNALVKTNISYHIFPFASSIESNEVMNLLLVHLRNCSYLLAALLTISATIHYNQTRNDDHALFGSNCTIICMRLLNEAFASGDKLILDSDNEITSLLLTDLVLASNFTAMYQVKNSNIVTWKTHLRGARDLLIRYSSLTESKNTQHVSSGLALAKTWFFAIESTAGITSTKGGTLTKVKDVCVEDSTDADVNYGGHADLIFSDTGYFSKEHNPQFHFALKRLKLLITSPVDFNLFLGYSMNVVRLTHELMQILDSLRCNKEWQLSVDSFAKLMALIYRAREFEIVPNVSKNSFIIPQGSPAHPENPKRSLELPASAYGKITGPSGNVIYYSWYDISEQIHVDYQYMKLLIGKGMLHLQPSHPLVKDLTRRIMSYLFFVRYKDPSYKNNYSNVLVETQNYYVLESEFDTRCVMIQSPFKICARLIDNELEFEKLELFFLGLTKLGNGGAYSVLSMLQKTKENLASKTTFLNNQQHLTSSKGPEKDEIDDIVCFS
ncbi:uncharacterized protein PRCAT00003065001 [Priceomyces carsonii]|uniref:uncharacterized protein n=1 Tax=Priceomyces carsonii TaxID=28549 RepID=UPI002ED96353|nr:unnamed protein product [Priceomyces carsonii]